MPAKKPKRTSKATKASKAKGAAKKAAPKALSQTDKAKRNQELLAKDKAFYNAMEKKNYGRRTKGNALHPKGVPLYTLRPDGKGFYRTEDNSIRLTDAQYERMALNPDAIPRYTPIRENGKIVYYRNTRTGDIVTPHYRHKIFGKEFNKIEDEQTRERSEIYQEALVQQRHAQIARTYDLVTSYRILHPDMTPNEVRASAHFQGLVAELGTFNYKQYGITPQNIALADEITGRNITVEGAKDALGSDPRYQEVMVQLGRRLPGETFAVGESDRDHIKNVVRPHYENRDE